MKEIRFDSAKQEFTFSLESVNGNHTESVRPPKYSLVDKYAKYRRDAAQQKE